MHIPADIIARIRHIELYTKRLLGNFLIGKNKSRLKGMGFEFDQLREYHIGDDIRSIDWASSARTQSIRIKQYLEERTRTVCLMIDVSTSMLYGIEEKYEKITWLASIMILIAAYSSDKVALLLYSDDIDVYIPARTGLMHARKLMYTLCSYKPKKSVTRLSTISQQLSLLKERSLVCVLSDFIDDSVEKAMKAMMYRHAVCAIRYLDQVERTLPSKGLLCMQDQETGAQAYINVSDLHNGSISLLDNRIQMQEYMFKKYGIRLFDIVHHQKPTDQLIQLLSSGIRY